MSSCESTTERFSDYYDGGLTPAERQALEEHLQACPTCRGEFETFTRALQALHDTEPLQTTQVFLRGVRAAVQEELGKAGAPSRIPPWVPWALAGVLAAGFIAGLLASRRGPDPGLIRSLEQLRGELARRAEPPREPGGTGAPPPVDEAALLARLGMVRSGEGWIPRFYDEAFREGKVFLGPGRAVSRREAARELSGELPSPSPGGAAADTPAREEEIFEKYGLVRHEGMVLPRAWLERWARGEVLAGVDRWRTAADFKADLMREHDLVEKGGRLMSRREAEEVAARRQIRRPEGATVSNALTAALEGLRIGVPAVGGGLTVYPLIAEKPVSGAAFRTLQEAMGMGKLEFTDREGFFSVQARHELETEVFLLAGQILQGGRCDRMVAADVLLPPGRATGVPVLCVEPGGWRSGVSRFGRESGHYVAPPSFRRALLAGAGQPGVWALLGMGPEKGVGLAEQFRRQTDRLVEFHDLSAGLAGREPGMTGLAVAWDGGVRMAELFPGPEVLGAFADRLIRGVALDLLRERESVPSPYADTLAGVKQFLEDLFTGTVEVREGGLELRRGEVVLGRASVGNRGILHAVFFVSPGAEGIPRVRATPALPREKLARVLSEYETRISDRAAGPLHKIEAIGELASLRLREVAAVLLRHLREADLAVRRAVIRSLGDLGDPAAVKDLLEVLRASRKEASVYAEAVRALARIGDERGVWEFLRQIDGGDPEAARTVVLSMPELLLQLKARDPLERALGRLVDLYGAAEAAARGEPGVDPGVRGYGRAEAQALAEAVRGALRQVTGLDFDRPALYLKWWNDRAGRERFFRERLGR